MLQPLTVNQRARQSIIELRQRLPTTQREAASTSVVRHIMKHPAFIRARHIALYYPFRGEVSPLELIFKSQSQQQFYLPVTPSSGEALTFKQWQANSPLHSNRLGIKEPMDQAPCIEANSLDLVIMPLVAFDDFGHRLGMGQGFYDLTFAFLNTSEEEADATGPVLLGVAYDFQRVNQLEPESWDVPLHGVVTPHWGVRLFPKKPRKVDTEVDSDAPPKVASEPKEQSREQSEKKQRSDAQNKTKPERFQSKERKPFKPSPKRGEARPNAGTKKQKR